jgi:ATP-dependent exoDNAse (exonuclease V) beta subunit
MTPQQILLVTFTKDAAEQLRERILARLKDERFNAFIQQ